MREERRVQGGREGRTEGAEREGGLYLKGLAETFEILEREGAGGGNGRREWGGQSGRAHKGVMKSIVESKTVGESRPIEGGHFHEFPVNGGTRQQLVGLWHKRLEKNESCRLL